MGGYDISLALSEALSSSLHGPLSITDNSTNISAKDEASATGSSVWPFVALAVGGVATALILRK